MRCMELWTQSLLVGEWREIKISECLLFFESARTLARLKNIQIQAQKCAGWRLSDWKDFLEDAKSTFLPPFAAHSFNNNANWVSVILDPVSYLQDQNGHSMLFPSQAWHLRVRFHEMTGLWNLFFVTWREIFLHKKFFLSRAKVNPWKPDDPAHNFPSLSNNRRSHRWPWNIDKVNIATAASSKKSNKRLTCTPDHQHSGTINNSYEEAAQMVTKR